MSIPRVVVGVTERTGVGTGIGSGPGSGSGSGAGWRVTVGTAAVPVATYDIDAVTLDVGGFPRRVPVVPAGRRPAAGEPHAALCAGDAEALRRLLERVAAVETEDDDVLRYGRWLFECLLAPAWTAVRDLPEVVAARGVELALDWPVTASDLHWLIWEAMHDGKAPLAGHADLLVALTRLVPVDAAADPSPSATIRRVPRVLFAAGSALNDQVIRPGAMFMGLLRSFDADGLCVTRTVQEASIADLDAQCATFRPDVVHLVAHGDHDDDGNGVVVLAKDRPGGGAVTAGRMLTALTAGGRPTLVVLSACHSGLADNGSAPLAARLVAGGIPIVSAMAGEVSEPACRLYTRRLVSAIHEGESVVEAVAHGRRAALVRSENPASRIDWALPALFLARSVQPGFRVVDPAPARRLVELADHLELRRRPVYVGRREVFQRVDELFATDPGRRLGFVGVVRDGSIQRLGSTRLLREIGFRLLREGHAPLLLGPYSEYGPPTNLRSVLVEIFQKVVLLAEQLGTSPPQATALAADPRFADVPAVQPFALAAMPPDEAIDQLLETLSRFAAAGDAGAAGAAGDAGAAGAAGGRDRSLDVQYVRRRLAGDLAALARTLGHHDQPFGPHTRVVVLADSMHTWADALGGLLAMVRKSGLGTVDCPVPLIGTSSLSEGKGPALKTFSEEHSGMPGFAFPQLTPLPDGEATLGFQWVLLHPWQYDRDPEYRRVYVSARGASADHVQRHLRLLKGVPTRVEEDLYLIAQSLLIEKHFLADDDDAAYQAYLEQHR